MNTLHQVESPLPFVATPGQLTASPDTSAQTHREAVRHGEFTLQAVPTTSYLEGGAHVLSTLSYFDDRLRRLARATATSVIPHTWGIYTLNEAEQTTQLAEYAEALQSEHSTIPLGAIIVARTAVIHEATILSKPAQRQVETRQSRYQQYLRNSQSPWGCATESYAHLNAELVVHGRVVVRKDGQPISGVARDWITDLTPNLEIVMPRSSFFS